MGYELTLADTLFAQLGATAQVAEDAWEVGRLVLAHECRSDVDALRRCLYLSLEYAHRQAKVKNLYAACTHVLARLYRRFGFSQVAAGVQLAGTDKSYTLIHGDADHVLRCLAGAQVSQ
ncbi:N-acyl amino acid synthase FeeM domain-containing protein [Caenimonas koreensis]|uniref:N-acetyltransferase n=1 Tax=Caenimonas koreensis DSM 17982 TaxID=1121255 RepID=A0A844BDG2_9BURK|nr:N-acetyltransferase [Caenimonas koreensis]MRD48531.1 N-acetyltransferase [Caenimonas koreensis DSM 17982]